MSAMFMVSQTAKDLILRQQGNKRQNIDNVFIDQNSISPDIPPAWGLSWIREFYN